MFATGEKKSPLIHHNKIIKRVQSGDMTIAKDFPRKFMRISEKLKVDSKYHSAAHCDVNVDVTFREKRTA